MELVNRIGAVRRDRVLAGAFKKLCLNDKGRVSDTALPVLAWLRGYCYASQSTIMYDKNGRMDAHASAAAAGRQEVWQQFYRYLNLNDAELLELDRWLQTQARQMRGPFENQG